MINVVENIELRKKTTFHLGGIVPYFYSLSNEEDILELRKIEKDKSLEIKILGGGSNILAADESLTKGKNLDFAVAQMQIHYENEDKFTEYFVWYDDELCPPLVKKVLQEEQSDKALRIEVGGGMPVAALLKLCANAGASGLEGLGGIPGKICGAIAMNAGAYDCEIDQVLETVRIYSDECGFLTLNRSEFINEYRKFTPYYEGKALENYLICGASFVFPFINRDLVQEKIKENIAKKKLSQPIKAYTAGCIFKNPVILPEQFEKMGFSGEIKSFGAGKILDLLGFKGMEKNGIRFSPIHANFLENFNNGTTQNAIEMIKEAKDKVFKSFDIILEEEVKLWL